MQNYYFPGSLWSTSIKCDYQRKLGCGALPCFAVFCILHLSHNVMQNYYFPGSLWSTSIKCDYQSSWWRDCNGLQGFISILLSWILGSYWDGFKLVLLGFQHHCRSDDYQIQSFPIYFHVAGTSDLQSASDSNDAERCNPDYSGFHHDMLSNGAPFIWSCPASSCRHCKMCACFSPSTQKV